ncbi:MAG: UvrB/UvrC motif-containing protein [Candidatus Omnitrophica bacterium]|nr:UvrB/UvrC motif-containing protein [Candidatus Omnitrophota bacterium]
MMNCDVCKIREATVHLTEVINSKVTKLHLCEHCAKDKSEEMQSHFGLTDLISGLMDIGPQVASDDLGEQTTLKCQACGMTYGDFQNTSKLGCGNCYETFKDRLSDLLTKIHGSDRHIGKMPFKGKTVVEEQEKLKQLKSELNDLIRGEQFEKAAITRDRIKDLEDKLLKK